METSQERQEWLKWRKSGIGSSDAPAIHGESPYLTPLELYTDKFTTDEVEEEENFITEKGNQFEPVARRLFAAAYNMHHKTEETFEAKRITSSDLPILIASLDGSSFNGEVTIEIKYQGIENHKKLGDKTLKLEERISRNYWIQVQHQLIISGAKKCYVVSYNPKAKEKNLEVLYWCEVRLDPEFASLHIQKCTEFWNNGLQGIAPEPTKDDYVALTKKGAKAKAKKLGKLKEKIKELTEEHDALKEELEAMITHPKMRCGNLRIVQQSKAGSIDYGKIPEVAKLEKTYLEKFRKAGTSFYKFTVEEETA